MKLIIAGSRKMTVTIKLISELMYNFKLEPTEIVHGDAEGIDTCGKWYADFIHIPATPFEPDYDAYYDNPRYAPIARNAQMAEYADALLLIWDGKSKGSANMRSQMYAKGKPVYEVILKSLTDDL